MDRAEKEQMVASLHRSFDDAAAVVVTHFTGLTATEASELRRRMRDVGARFRVTKNSLTRRALQDTPYAGLADLFTGPTAVAFSDDPVAASKASVDFAKAGGHLVIVGGALGERRLDKSQIRALASLPSLEALRAGLAGLLVRPAAGLAATLAAPAGQLARVLGAYGSGSEAA